MFGGEKEGVFVLSEKTGAGDELGWDFLDMVRKGRLSFTGKQFKVLMFNPRLEIENFSHCFYVFLSPGFCKLKTKDYLTTCAKSAPFMSPKTFVKWALSWMVAFKVDFRTEVDPICKHDPPMLVMFDRNIQFFTSLGFVQQIWSREA